MGEGDGEKPKEVKPGPIPPPSEWGWTGELPPENISTVAPVSHELWRRGREWVNRCVQTVELLDVATVRLRLSIDFRIPRNLPGAEALAGETYFLPLTVMERRTNFAYFDLKDEEGTSIPILTRQENARLSGGMLVSAARRALRDEKKLELSPALLAYLATIPKRPRRDGRALVRAVLNPADPLLYPDRRVAKALLIDPEFRDLLGVCAVCSFIHLPVAAAAGKRKIIKISVLSPWGPSPQEQGKDGGGGRGKSWRELATWIGWRAEARYLFLPHFGNAESFHLQLEAPPRVEFTEAATRTSRPAELVREEAAAAPALPDLPEENRNDALGYEQFIPGISKRKHLYVGPSHEHRTGIAWVRFRVIRHGFSRAAMGVAWLTTILLALFAIRADNVLGEAQTAAALLLLVPALIAGFLIGPGEHPMTRHLLRGPRAMTATVGLLALLATAAMLTLPNPDAAGAPCALVVIWGVEAALAGLLAIGLTVGMVWPKAAKERPQPPPAAGDQPQIGPMTEEEAGSGGNV